MHSLARFDAIVYAITTGVSDFQRKLNDCTDVMSNVKCISSNILYTL